METADLPKYQQVKRMIIREIEEGKLMPGGAVPSEAELVERFNVSRPTLVRSLQDLVRDGYVYRRQGKGTFVSEQLPNRGEPVSVGDQPAVPLFVADSTARLSGDAREVLLRFMRGVEDGLTSSGMGLRLRSCSENKIDADTWRYLEQTPPGRAMVVEPSMYLPNLWKELQQRGWQLWALNERVNDGHCVVIDQEYAGYLATQHLIKQGCKNIALLNGPLDMYWGFPARLNGYRTALRESQISWNKDLVFQGTHVIDSEAGRAMMTQLIRSGVTFDGVVAVTDSKAIGAMLVAQENGLEVGRQVRFVSIDNTCADRAPHPLTSVAMPFEEVGRIAATMALSGISMTPGVDAFHQVLLKPTLIER
jgi:GntR family transcriptional regulator of arabinose operon